MSQSSNKVAVAARIPAKEGKGAELAAALQFALDNVKSEPGTLSYILHADASNPDSLWMYELYESQDALNAHMGSEWFKQLGPKIGALMGGAPELIFLAPIGGKGL